MDGRPLAPTTGYIRSMPATFTLETARLRLRPHTPGDAPFMVRLNADPACIRYTGDRAFPHPSEALAVVAALRSQWADRRMGRFLVEERQTGERVGWCGLKWHADTGDADLGYRFLQDRWGRGYATEASRACIGYAWGPLDLDHLVARAMPENIASVRVLEKLGFRFTGPEVDGGLAVHAFRLDRPAA